MSFLCRSREHGKLIKNGVIATALCILMVSVPGCCLIRKGSGLGKLYTPKEWIRLLKSKGFTPVPFPDSKYVPGSIIKVTDDEGVSWIDDLSSCRYPLSEFELKSYIPTITFTKNIEYGASTVINIRGITAGPGFDRVSKVRMEITDHGADAFRLIKLEVWMEDPDNREKVSQKCMDYLLQPDIYLVNEAFRVSKGTYTLFDKTGAAIKLETPTIGNLLQFQPEVKYEITNDGSLIIEQPVVLAIRKAVRIGKGFQTLRSPGDEEITADAKIEKLFLKTAIKK